MNRQWTLVGYKEKWRRKCFSDWDEWYDEGIQGHRGVEKEKRVRGKELCWD